MCAIQESMLMEERLGRQTPARLLIVEDDESQLRTLTAIMQEEDFDVIGCSTASEALEHLNHLETCVVVLDLRLPDLNGTQLMERLADVKNNFRVIINTAYSSYESARDSLNLGAFAYVEKAGDPEELLRHVHRAFAASLRSYADQLEIAVAERTRELRQANELLDKKITEQEKTEKQRRQERGKAQQYLDVAAVMLVAIDSEERVGMINRKGCEILEYEEKEILGKNWFDNFLPQRVRDEARAVFETSVREQADALEYFENPVLTKDGRERLIAWHNTALTDDQGNFVAILSSGEDITEHKRIKKALEQSEEKYRDLFEHARDAIVTFDPEGNITDANKAVEEYGFKREELMGKSLFDFVIEEHRDKAVEDFETLIGGRSVRDEMDVITPKGTITVEYCDNPIIRGKHVVGVQAILTDITDRKEAERVLRESEERLKILFESTPDAIYLNDLEGYFVDGNNAAEELSGFKRGELVGKNFTEVGLLSSDGIPKAVANLERIAAGQTAGPDEFTLTKTDGSRVMVEIRAYPVQINNRTLSLWIAHDITNRKEAEERLLEYQAKLKAMASEIIRAQDRERKRIAIGLHDNICQNLVITKVLLQSTLRLVSDPSVSGPLKMACGAMSELIDQFDALIYELSNPVLRELGLVMALKKHLAEEVQQKYGIAFKLEGDERLSIPNEELKSCLFRVSRELLMNVVKHAQASNVKVSIHKMRSRIRIVIQDDGVGFDSNEVSSEVFRTSRFGLFSIREQLEHLGGNFEIESKPGQGTTVTVVVPLGENTVG
jgi:PAS domain S-box-containing protein